MNTLEIKIPTFYGVRKLTFKAESDFNSLSKGKLLRLVRLIFSDQDIIVKKSKATFILFGLKYWQLRLIKPNQLAYLNTFSEWLFNGENFLTDNKIEKISFGLFQQKLYGPLGGFETLTAKEWTDADTAFAEYISEQDESSLDDLIAILWRPRDKKVKKSYEDFKYDVRVPYNSFLVDRRAARIKFIDPSIKYAILLWYIGCRKEWEMVFDKVFSSDTKQQVENYGWSETIQKISGDKFGSLMETENSPMHKVLLNMQIDIKDFEEMKRKNQKQHA